MLRHPTVTSAPVEARWPATTATERFVTTAAFTEHVARVEHVPVTGSDVGDDASIIGLGFVDAGVQAYSRHHGLVWRADDVWQAVVTQLSFYIQKNAEKLRGKFVTHKGREKLVVKSHGTLFTAPWGDIAQLFLGEINKTMKDSSITTWLTPDFTTTTDTDRVAAAISAMATFQTYYSYQCDLMCGLPSIELLGTVEDWHKLAARIERIAEFDAGDGHLTKWAAMLEPVIAEMVATKEGKGDVEWWQRIAHHVGGGSGPTFLSGWITVFAVFDHRGNWQGDTHEMKFWMDPEPVRSEWPIVDTDGVPNAVLVVPMKIDDNGVALYNAVLTAGQVASSVVDDGTKLAPRTDWALYVPKEELAQRAA